MNNKKTSWKLAALVGVVGLAVGGGIGAGIAVSTTEPEMKTVTETVEVEQEVTPGSCFEAIAYGREVIGLNADPIDRSQGMLARQADDAVANWERASEDCLSADSP